VSGQVPESGYRRLLACYPPQYREEILGVLMQQSEHAYGRPGFWDAADLVVGGIRVRLRSLRVTVDGRAPWRDALAQFSLLAPMLLLIANLTTAAYLWRLAVVSHPAVPRNFWQQLAATLLMLAVAGQLPLLLALAFRLRRTAMVIVILTSAYWGFRYQGGMHFNSPTVTFYLGFCLFEATALFSARYQSPNERVTWRQYAILVPAGVLVGIFWLDELASPNRIAGEVVLALLALIIATVLLAAGRARHLIALLALMLYPSAIDVGLAAGMANQLLTPASAWTSLIYLPPVAAALGATRAGVRPG
jgi:hypothetical protein